MKKTFNVNFTKENKILLLIVLTFFIIFTTISLNRYWQYSTWYFDFGIFYTAISSVAQLKEPIIDHLSFGEINILGDHFHPIIFLISPFVAIFKRGEVLLIFQSLFVSLSGFFIYKISKFYQKTVFESFAFLILYFSFIGLHNALITEFHAITLLPLPLSIFFFGMLEKKKFWYFLGFIFVLLTKESTFIIPAWFSLIILLRNKGEWRKIGLFTMIASFAYGYFLLNFVFKFFNGTGYYYIKEASGGKIIPELTPLKVKTIFYSLANFGFLPLFAPETWPPILFSWWTRFTSIATIRHDLGMHYNAEVTPTLLLAANIGWLRFKSFSNTKFLSIKKYHLNIILYSIIVLTAFSNYFILKSPVLLFGNIDFYKHTQRSEFLDRLIENIPDDGIIMAQTNIAAKISYRKVYMLRENYDSFPQDYIVVDFRDGQEPNNFLGVDFEQFKKNILIDPNYEVYYDQGEQKIYKKIQD